jgi:hypothetical protein
MLRQHYSRKQLENVLTASSAWRPYPVATDRQAWAAAPAALREAYLAEAKKNQGYCWPELPATLFLGFARKGNRSEYEKVYFQRRSTLFSFCIAEAIDGQGRFLDDLINGIWAFCEESFWGLPAHNNNIHGYPLPDVDEPIVDLFAAETAAQLAWTCYLHREALAQVSPVICRRVHDEIQRRILKPCQQRTDFWWMGHSRADLNNWTPWIVSNWLACLLLVEQDQHLRATMVHKAICVLDRFLDKHPEDGGCDEGPGYWGRAGASVFDCLELLYLASDGAVDIFQQPLIKKLGEYFVKVHIAEDWMVNFADAAARVTANPTLLYAFGQRVDSPVLRQMGLWAGRQPLDAAQRIPSMLRTLSGIFDFNEPYQNARQADSPPYLRYAWMEQIQVLCTREKAGCKEGLFLAAKGGHNAESHNHNDIGNLIVYAQGRPLFVDAGVDTYSQKTFSAQRYELWAMQSAYHSLLPVFDGVQQVPGRQFRANEVQAGDSEQESSLQLDIAGAYPAEAKILSWRRRISLVRQQGVHICDEFVLRAPVKNITLRLLTPSQIIEEAAGRFRLQTQALPKQAASADGRLYMTPALPMRSETLSTLPGGNLAAVWGDALQAMVFSWENPPMEGRLETWIKLA